MKKPDVKKPEDESKKKTDEVAAKKAKEDADQKKKDDEEAAETKSEADAATKMAEAKRQEDLHNHTTQPLFMLTQAGVQMMKDNPDLG